MHIYYLLNYCIVNRGYIYQFSLVFGGIHLLQSTEYRVQYIENVHNSIVSCPCIHAHVQYIYKCMINACTHHVTCIVCTMPLVQPGSVGEGYCTKYCCSPPFRLIVALDAILKATGNRQQGCSTHVDSKGYGSCLWQGLLN